MSARNRGAIGRARAVGGRHPAARIGTGRNVSGYRFVVDLDIRPLTNETWPALAALFEEGGDPRWCYCQF
jgi:hypothetical protein